VQSKKIFISYSHDSNEHKNWVRKLAEDLMRNGVETILDSWHLQVADDLAHFMENAIRESNYTLLICTPHFAHKVNNRKGGVSYEANLVIGSILSNFHDQGKFIPILKEGLPSDSIPLYLRTKLFLDFTNEALYDQSFETLLRRIFDAPLYMPQAAWRKVLSQYPINLAQQTWHWWNQSLCTAMPAIPFCEANRKL
jgi:hypothetical protein